MFRIKSILILTSLLFLFIGCNPVKRAGQEVAIGVSFPDSVSEMSLDGRLLLMLSSDPSSEPRFQINSGLNTQLVYGMNVEGMRAGQVVSFDRDAYGFPYESISEVPPGEYHAQALLHVYETFNLSTGHMVKLPMDNGEGQQWNRSPGNLYSKPVKVTVGDNGISGIQLAMDQKIPPI